MIGPAIRDEAKEWSKGAIYDVFLADIGKCPKDYEVLTTTFWGTSPYCISNGKMTVGYCGK